jgi:hypothetical protein
MVPDILIYAGSPSTLRLVHTIDGEQLPACVRSHPRTKN